MYREASWWLNQPILKNMIVKLEIFPKSSCVNEKYGRNHHLVISPGMILQVKSPVLGAIPDPPWRVRGGSKDTHEATRHGPKPI